MQRLHISPLLRDLVCDLWEGFQNVVGNLLRSEARATHLDIEASPSVDEHERRRRYLLDLKGETQSPSVTERKPDRQDSSSRGK